MCFELGGGSWTWFLPITDALALLVHNFCHCFEYCTFCSVVSSSPAPATSRVPHQNPALSPPPKAKSAPRSVYAIDKHTLIPLSARRHVCTHTCLHCHNEKHDITPHISRASSVPRRAHIRSHAGRVPKPWHSGPCYNYKADEHMATKRSREGSGADRSDRGNDLWNKEADLGEQVQESATGPHDTTGTTLENF